MLNFYEANPYELRIDSFLAWITRESVSLDREDGRATGQPQGVEPRRS